MELEKDLLKMIQDNQNQFQDVLKAYNNIKRLIKKDPISNFLLIKEAAENIDKFLKEKTKIKEIKKVDLKSIEEINENNLENLAEQLNYKNGDNQPKNIQKIHLDIKENFEEVKFLDVMRKVYNKTHSRAIKSFNAKTFKVWLIKFPSLIEIRVKSESKNVKEIKKSIIKIIPQKDDIILEDIKNWTVKELRAYCKKIGVIGVSKSKKADIIKKIQNKVKQQQNQKKITDSITKEPNKSYANYKINDEITRRLELYLQALFLEISEWREKFKKKFGLKLEELLKKIGFELKGSYPVLNTSFFSIETNFDRGNVVIWYGPQQERLDSCNFIPETIVENLKGYHKNITQREFYDEKFLQLLKEAYRIATYREGKRIGDSLPIMKVLLDYIFLIQNNQFRANPNKINYYDYNRVLFSFDLYKLKKRIINNYELSLITATRAFTKQHSDFIWIPTNERGAGNYISHIKFMEKKL